MMRTDDPHAALIRWIVQNAASEGDSVGGPSLVVGIEGGAVGPGTPRTRAPTTGFSEVQEGVPPMRSLPDDLGSLSLALEAASPPTHAFGRAGTTGFDGGSAAEDREFDRLLAELGLHWGCMRRRCESMWW